MYRDEYFEQCMSQTRRFGEHVCKKFWVRTEQQKIPLMRCLQPLKIKPMVQNRKKEFINDLYFLKKQGNSSVHGSKVKKDGMAALECLQRAFEVGINYAVYNKKRK